MHDKWLLCLHEHVVSFTFTFVIRTRIISLNDFIFADFAVQLLNLDCVLQKLLYVVVNI